MSVTDPEIAEEIVDLVNSTYGRHPGYRAVHAKGVLCGATFVPTADGGRTVPGGSLPRSARARPRPLLQCQR